MHIDVSCTTRKLKITDYILSKNLNSPSYNLSIELLKKFINKNVRRYN